jgi:superfamily II DNA or RNA helicase
VKIRPYQEKGRVAIHKEWESLQSTLVVMPTGTGKTRLASAIIEDRRRFRSLFICHRQELVFQAAEHIKQVTNLNVGIEMGDFKTINDGLFNRPDVIVASVQTLCSGGDGGGRMAKFNPDDFQTVIADEAHHSPSDSWRSVLDFFLQNKNCKLLGITATPDRADEEALGQIFDSVAFDYEILDAIKDGWLVPIEQQMVSSIIEEEAFGKMRTTAGDLNGAD